MSAGDLPSQFRIAIKLKLNIIVHLLMLNIFQSKNEHNIGRTKKYGKT
jgi:hypothetical protein